MKVTNHKIGPSSPKIDSAKTAKSEGAKGLSGLEDLKSGKKSEGAAQPNHVHVSERAQMFQRAKEIAGRPDTVDESKVARLQKMIDEGKYKVDADAIADRMVDEHLKTEL
jgi:negative regulator of flagellin synthesis FlgM